MITDMLLELLGDEEDMGFQSREAINESAVSEYAQALKRGDSFPAITVFQDETGSYWLADGFHRVQAAREIGLTTFKARVLQGTQVEAAWFGVTSNKNHGVRRTNSDKRRAAEMALVIKPDLSDSALASEIGCSQPFVSKVRREMVADGHEELRVAVRKCADGSEMEIPDGETPWKEPAEPKEPAPAEVGADQKKLVKAIRKQLDVVVNMLQDNAENPDFANVRIHQFMQPLEEVEHLLVDYCTPYKDCPICGGTGCGECRHKGWVTKIEHERIVKDRE